MNQYRVDRYSVSLCLGVLSLMPACIGGKSSSGPGGGEDSAETAEHCDTASPADTGAQEPALEERCVVASESLGDALMLDTFTRTGPDLSGAEQGGYSYVEASGENTGYAIITGETLQLHYFAGEDGSQPNQWVNVDRLAVADFVLDVSMRPYSTGYNNRLGLSYRMPTHDGISGRSGYHVFLEKDTLGLYAGEQLLDSAAVGEDTKWHDYRIAVAGEVHCVFLDDTLVLAAADDTFPQAGYLGAGAYYSIGYFDDLTVYAHPDPSTDAATTFDAHQASVSLASGERSKLDTASSESLEVAFEAQVDAVERADSYGVWLRGGDGLQLSIEAEAVMLEAAGVVVASVLLAEDGDPHRFRLLTTGRAVRVYRDGLLLFDVVLDAAPGVGDAGLFAEGGSAEFLDIGVRWLDPEPVYPAGALDSAATSAFPVLFYSVSDTVQQQAVALGANLVQAYVGQDDGAAYVESAARAGVRASGIIGSYVVDDTQPSTFSEEDSVTEIIGRATAGTNLGWWDVPEELRFWRSDEMEELTNLLEWTRAGDPDQSPVFMYIPGHYNAEGIAEYVPYLDIIGKGSYVDYALQPRAWVRHQLESTLEGIEQAGHAIGPNYLAGERTALVIVGLFPGSPASAAELYHDVWSGIASGAQGIALYSYFYAYDSDVDDGLAGFVKAAGVLNGESGFGPAVLSGEPVEGIGIEITDGATQTEAFTPYGDKESKSYGCLNVAAWTHDGARYVVAVNSCESAVSATLSGLGDGAEARVWLESRVLCLDEGTLEDTFEPLGVHLYRIETP